MSLNTTKACQVADIPTKILKKNADMFSDFLFAYYNASFAKSSKFLPTLTLADIIPVFKKRDKECKNNHRQMIIHTMALSDKLITFSQTLRIYYNTSTLFWDF